MAFGSFSSAQNAQNWASKLSALFAHDMQVTTVEKAGQTLFRVASQELSAQHYTQMSRQATASGIQFWRLVTVAPSSVTTVTEPGKASTEAAPPASAVRRVEPLGAPRIKPPSPAADVSAEPTQASSRSAQWRQGGTMEWDFGLQGRVFSERGFDGQDRAEASVSAQFEYFKGWANDTHSVTFSPFVRLDSADDKRTHADIRELFYSFVGDSWDVHVGAKRVFWGVTEFHHLIDIVNQTDLVENIDTEDKLGQPMVQLSLVRDWGVLDIYALLGFRERTYPGEDGRLRFPYVVSDGADYESGAENMRTDFAVRWSHFLGPFEFGLHHFSGTSRDPLLNPRVRPNGDIVLRPFYPVIDQTGIDAQAFYGDWAFKIEGFSRSGFGARYAAANIGFERTLVGLLGSRADLGLVAEYLFDERDEEAFNTVFENDLALGTRFSLNDFADTQALLGVIVDTNNSDYAVSLEASRRLGQDWLLNVEGRWFASDNKLRRGMPPVMILDPDYKSAWLDQDDYLQLELKKFF